MAPRSIAMSLLLLACSSDKVTLGGSSKRVALLDIEETAKLCEDIGQLRTRSLSTDQRSRLDCAAEARTAMALASSDPVAVCHQAFERCRKAPPDEVPLRCESFKTVFACVTLTVDDLDRCFQEQLDTLRSIAATDPCTTPPATPKRGRACEAIELRCSEVPELPPSMRATGEAIDQMASFAKAMCQCTDKTCAEWVNARMTTWGTELARSAKPAKEEKATPELARRSADVMTRYTECMTKAMMAGAATTPPDE